MALWRGISNASLAWVRAELCRHTGEIVIPARCRCIVFVASVEDKVANWMGLEIEREKARIVQSGRDPPTRLSRNQKGCVSAARESVERGE
ncbi:MAG: hypothetical protein HYX75_14580 [Acidobacteria bacterium]|nr:hypothetical protein [Acidobacteriota bacterium]